MPIQPHHPVRRMTQAEFRDLSYAVMREVFKIHNEFGRFFDEWIYKRVLQTRFPGVELEFPITAIHRTFSKTYFVDALIAGGGPFEFKAVDILTPRHRGQLYNYLLLLDLAHGKLVNLRPESVCHEFVNSTVRMADRYRFEIVTDRWNQSLKRSNVFLELVTGLLNDWGAGLEVCMYEAALTHLLGGEDRVHRALTVRSDEDALGEQIMCVIEDDIGFRVTSFPGHNADFETHIQRLMQHVDLSAVYWVNIDLKQVTFITVEKSLVTEGLTSL